MLRYFRIAKKIDKSPAEMFTIVFVVMVEGYILLLLNKNGAFEVIINKIIFFMILVGVIVGLILREKKKIISNNDKSLTINDINYYSICNLLLGLLAIMITLMIV